MRWISAILAHDMYSVASYRAPMYVVPFGPPAPVRPPFRIWHVVVAIGIGIACQLPAGYEWLGSNYEFVRTGSPDSLFLVALDTLLLEIPAVLALAGAGISLCFLRRARGFGYGLLIGVLIGIVGLVAGTFLVVFIAA
jgi:hypothetical protein